MAKLLLKRGLSNNLTSITLDAGEPAYTTDGKKLYIGNADGTKTLINPDKEALTVDDIPTLPSSKITGLGTAATKNTGTSSGNIPVLNTSGKLEESVLPAIAISDTFEVSSEAAMLALDAQRGDIVIRSDLDKTYVLKQSPATTLANWVILKTPTDAVLSVAGRTGAVTLSKSDVGLGNVDNTADSSKSVASAAKLTTPITINGVSFDGSANITIADTTKAPLASPALTGTPTAPTPTTADSSTKIATTAYVQAQGYLKDSSILDGGTF